GTLAECGPGIVIGGHEYASPYRLVLGWMPGFGTVRLPTRFVLVAQLGFALLAGLGLGRLLDGGRRWVAWPIACVTIALAIWSFTPLPTLPLHAEVTGDELPGEWGGDLLLRVTRAVVQDRRANLLNPLRTPGGVPLEPLVECPGALRLAAPPPDPWPPQAPRQVQVDVLNLGGRPWPAFGF